MEAERQDPGSDNHLIYDGECPFCSRYVRMTRLRDTVGPIELIDLRFGRSTVLRLTGRGLLGY